MATPRPPAVRALPLKDDLRSIAVLGAPAEARIRARLRPTTISEAERAADTEFLPLELNIEMCEAVFAEAGEPGVRRWGAASLVASLDGFFKPLLLGLTKLVAPTPTLLYRTLPQGWTTTYQSCGELFVTQLEPGRTRVTGRGLAPAMASRAFRLAVCGTLESAFQVSKYRGTVTLEPPSASQGDASWLSEWKAI